VWRRGHASGGGAVVAARAIGVGGRVGELSARPAGKGRRCAGVTGDAVRTIGGDVAGERSRPQCALRTLTSEGSVVTGVAAAGADRAVIHRVGDKTRCRIVVAVAALNARHRNVWRGFHAGGGGAVVAARAIGVGRCVGELPACPAGESRSRSGVTGDAVAAAGGDVTWKRRRALRALGSLARERAVVTAIATAGANGRMTRRAHGVGDKTRCRIGVTVAALNAGHRNVRRRGHAGRGGAVVTIGTIGVGGRVGELPACPAGESRGRAGVTGDAVAAVGRDVTGERRRALSALGPLASVRAVVTAIAPAGADGRVTGRAHRIGGKARGRIGMAVAALNTRHRNVRRRGHAGRRRAVVAARAVGVGGRVGELPACPAGESRGRAGVTGDAVAAVGRDVTGERRRALRALSSLTGERAVVTGVAAAGADRRVTGHAHRVGGKARGRIGMAIAALNTRHRNVRRGLHASRGGAVVAARAIGVGRRVGERSP
jgi:hypothetical protein